MELKNFDAILSRAPQLSHPLRVILAGSDGENMLKGLFDAQEKGLAQPVLVGDRARTITLLDQMGLTDKPYTLVDVPPGHSITQAAIDIINSGDGDVLMRGNLPTRDFLMPVLDKKNGLRTRRLMSHVSLASIPEYPKLLAISDVTVTIAPTLAQKKAIIRNMADALKAFGYENPKLALLAMVENVNFHMPETVDAQRLVAEHKQNPFADCELWGPISYDLILSKEACRLKNYDCPWSGGGFDGIIAHNLSVANTLVKSWLIQGHAITCGAVVGAKVPIALTSRSDDAVESFLSLVFCAALVEWKKSQPQ
ncbi:Phosphate acetyltransferase [bioreactor metagenome]|uniref:Phosphate acetyltransferase n=1 Tax=bioreactor metagenome TaxID=1076179 RepID=A0A645D613_9ZZZZ